ncbi:MAG: quinolinate synthase NadA [Planctomycetota bacterium]
MKERTVRSAVETDRSIRPSGLQLLPDLPICQSDLPLDWYQEEFKPYAEEYLALPDRMPETVLPWMDRYVRAALDHFGEELLLLAHFYMGGEIVKLVERYGGKVADSYMLARQAADSPKVRFIVESAVHFMAESIAILAHAHQEVYITNPKAGCTMEMMAKEHMVEPIFDELHELFGDDLLVVTYMNTSGRLKAIAGRTGGAVCTSANAGKVVSWALEQGRRIFFLPDRHLAENTAARVGIAPQRHYVLPYGSEAIHFRVADLDRRERERLERADYFIWGGYCGVHTIFKPEHVRYWKERGYRVVVHPECPRDVVAIADGAGSTNYLWDQVMRAEPRSRLAVATEGHFVRNAREQAAIRGVEVVHMADIPDPELQSLGCGCATMSRNDPPHLAAMLDLLRQGKAPDLNRVLPGDIVDEHTGWRERPDPAARAEIAEQARRALRAMIEITEKK